MRRIKLLITFLFVLNLGFSQSAAQIYDLAYHQLKQGVNAALVLQTLESCMRMDSNYEPAYMLRAFIFYELEDYPAAIKDYDAVVKINPKNEEALKKRAIAKVSNKDIEGAIADHNLRLKNDSTNAVAYFDRAYCYGVQGAIEKAIADYSKAIEHDESYVAAYVNRGLAQLNSFRTTNGRKPKVEEAETICEDFQKALELGAVNMMTYLEEYCIEK